MVYAEEIVLQPGPADGTDVWITSVFYGGGIDDTYLHVGGWGDYYYSLIKFNLAGLPASATRVTLHLHTRGTNVPVSMYLDRVTSYWDESTKWQIRPSTLNIQTIPAPTLDSWYLIDITDLYNSWQNSEFPNHGIMLRPTATSGVWSRFYS